MTNSLTVVVGSGACIDIGGLDVVKLTDKIYDFKDNEEDFDLCNMEILYNVRNLNSETQCNFEVIFNELEILYNNNNAIACNRFKINETARLFIDKLRRKINDYDTDFDESGWYGNFWRNICVRFPTSTIATLNYDTTIERSLSENDYTTGFTRNGDNNMKYFERKKFHDEINKVKIMHLHGCINYWYADMSDDKNGLRDQCEYDTYSNVSRSIRNRSSAQDGYVLFDGPIITGLRKTDKVIPYPYSGYFYELQTALMNNNKLLIIGYSFCDDYINSQLIRLRDYHGDNIKVVIVDYILDETINDNCDFWACFEGQKRQQLTMSIRNLIGEDNTESMRNIFNENSNYVTDKYNTIRFYYKGFRSFIENDYEDAMIFLS